MRLWLLNHGKKASDKEQRARQLLKELQVPPLSNERDIARRRMDCGRLP